MCFHDFTPDYARFGKATGNVGLQYLMYLDRHYHRKESGTDFRGYAKEDKFDVDETDHVRLYSFDDYVMQFSSGLAEGATGMHDRHRYHVYYTLLSHVMKNVQFDGLANAIPEYFL